MNYPMSIEATASTFVRGGMFPDLKSEEQAATLLIIGRGFNISDYDSVTGLYLRQGKVNMHANVMATAIKASGKYDYEVVENSDQQCEIQFFRVDATGRHPLGVHTFSMAQAQRAGLNKNFTWKQYPEAMLFARCISSGYRAHCPDALGAAPVYVEQHGEMEVEGSTNHTPPPAQRAVPEKPSTVVDETQEVPVRHALLDQVGEWAEVPKEQAVALVMQLLTELKLPTDGTVEELDLASVLLWVTNCRKRGVDWADAHGTEFDGLVKTIAKFAPEGEENIDF